MVQVNHYGEVYLLGTSFGASTDSAGTYRIQDIPVGKYTLVCDYIGYRSQNQTIYISAYDSDIDTDTDQSYLDKMGLEEDEDTDSDIIKGNDLKEINFELEEDVFNSQEVVVTGVASERSGRHRKTEIPYLLFLLDSQEE